VHTDRFGVPGSLNLELVLADASELEAAEALLESTVASLAQSASEAELNTAKASLRTQWYRTARDASALAFEIGHFQTMDSWETLPKYLQARDAMKLDDIKRIADAYFVVDNRTVGLARPRHALASQQLTLQQQPSQEQQP
ncbi:MAG: insulinase family protein, partial [Congregibacter sp.]|nr:insulinase family protein [Congregibacter sp.]